jgi:hypothetical protein
MRTLELRTVKGLSDKFNVLSSATGAFYILENDILYDATLDKKYNLTKGASHRMSRLNLIIIL